MIFSRDQDAFGHAHGGRSQRLQQAVDTNARLQHIAEGLDVQVRGTLLDRQSEEIVQGPDRPARASKSRRSSVSSATVASAAAAVLAARLRVVLASRRIDIVRGAIATATSRRNATSAARTVSSSIGRATASVSIPTDPRMESPPP